MRCFVPFLVVLSLAACVTPPSARYREVLPDERVMINLPVDPAAVERDKAWSAYYLLTAEVTAEVNGLVGWVLLALDTVTALPPSWSDDAADTAVWGPFADALDPTEVLVVVHHDASTDVHTWAIQQRPREEAGDDGAWVTVIAGQVDAGATAAASSGYFGIDFEAMAALDPTVEATGTFGCEYALSEAGVAATAGFEGFSDGGDPFTAYYHYVQVAGGAGRMDLALEHDVDPENGLGNPESHLVRARWEASGAGRADAYVTGGDLGALVATASECWDAGFEWVYQTDNYSGSPDQGDVGACVYATPEYDEDAGVR